MRIINYFKEFFSKDFIKGMGSVLDIAGSGSFYYRNHFMNKDLIPQEQDALAIKNVWETIVGEDSRGTSKKSLVTKLKN